jgi:hypothetical protein
MNKFSKLVPWMTRLVLLPPTVVLSITAARYLIHPVYSAALLGMTFCINLGLTTARILLGGFPLGCALFLAICLFSRRHVLAGLTNTWDAATSLLCSGFPAVSREACSIASYRLPSDVNRAELR